MFPGEASAPGNIYHVTRTKGGRVEGVSVPANWYPGGKGGCREGLGSCMLYFRGRQAWGNRRMEV